jgi:hypothetical protein
MTRASSQQTLRGFAQQRIRVIVQYLGVMLLTHWSHGVPNGVGHQI